jgi:hypothetical protein
MIKMASKSETPFTRSISTPRLTYFITRNNNTPVPLIPADELPITVKLQHIPRVLAPEDTYGLQYVGNAPYAGKMFQIEQDGIASPFLAPDAMARQKRPVSMPQSVTPWRRTDPDSSPSVIDAILRSEVGAEAADRVGYRTNTKTPPPSGILPDQDKKVFCTHWIMTGDCKFVQQGCRYKHEMPTEGKLKELGIRHVPRWWLEQNSAIKLGRNMKPIEWLKKVMNDEDADDADGEEEDGKDTKEGAHPERKTMSKTSSSNSSPSIPPARPTTPVLISAPKDIDLIDFTPLLPQPAYVLRSCFSAQPSSSVSSTSSGSSSSKKVFIPAGEPVIHHIAEFKKRERVAGRVDGTKSVTTKVTDKRSHHHRGGDRTRRPASQSPKKKELKA